MATIGDSDRFVNDEALTSLSNRFQSLQHELDSLQQEYHRVYAHHGQKCVSSLYISVKSLFEVITCVKKADKTLVDWHYRSDAFKNTLRWIGVDRRTHTVIGKKTEKLKKKVASVEVEFNKANDVFGDGVAAATRLKDKFGKFLVRSVGEVSQEAMQTRNAYDEDRKQVEDKIHEQESEHQGVTAQVASTTQSIQQLREQSDQSQTMRFAMTAGSLGSFGLAATSAFVFPPSLMVTAPLAALGVGTAAAAYSYDIHVRSLKDQQGELNQMLAVHEASIEELKAELTVLAQEHSKYTSTLQKVEELQGKTGVMRFEAEKSGDQLRQAQTVLDGVRNRLEVITEQLEECQYAKTRRDIAKRLREIVVSIQGISDKQVLWLSQDKQKKHLWQKQDNVKRAMLALAEIDEKTGKVLEIATLVDQGSL